MEKEFDFNSIGKRTPYRVPDGFFDQLEADVMNVVAQEPAMKAARRVSWIRRAVRAAVATAAVVGLFFMCNPFRQAEPENSMEKVEQAFSQLSTADQAYMLQLYQNDVFMNQ